MNKSFQTFVGAIAGIFSLVSMVLGIVLTNSVNITFWRMIAYDMVFVVQFLTFLWCAVVFARNQDSTKY